MVDVKFCVFWAKTLFCEQENILTMFKCEIRNFILNLTIIELIREVSINYDS